MGTPPSSLKSSLKKEFPGESTLPTTPRFSTSDLQPNSKKSNKSEKRVLFSDEIEFDSDFKMENSAKKRKNRDLDLDGDVMDMGGIDVEHGSRKKKKKKHRDSGDDHVDDDNDDDEIFGGFAGRMVNGYKNTFILAESQVEVEPSDSDSDIFSSTFEVEDDSQQTQQDNAVFSTSTSDEGTGKVKSKKDKKRASLGGDENATEQKRSGKENGVPNPIIPPIRKKTPIPPPKLLSISSALKPVIGKESFTGAFEAAKRRIEAVRQTPPIAHNAIAEGHQSRVEGREGPLNATLKHTLKMDNVQIDQSVIDQSVTDPVARPAAQKVTPIPPPKLIFLSKPITPASTHPSSNGKSSSNKTILQGSALPTSNGKPVTPTILPPPATKSAKSKAKTHIETNGSPNIHSTINKVAKPAPAVQNQVAEWESNPGTIRGKSSSDALARSENIAFAAQYITTHPNGISLGKTRFQVLYLGAGKKHKFPSTSSSGDEDDEDSKEEMLCSVAKGSLNVRLDGERFSIGENGMWRVRLGEGCTLRNKSGEEAVVHITAIRSA